jgi:flagellin
MVINHNVSAQTAAGNLQNSQLMLSKSLSRLSSGKKITTPADDAAGLAVSTRLDSQVHRTTAANDNVGNAISFTQTQDGYLKKIGQALDRMAELSIMAQDSTKTDADRALYDTEFSQLNSFVSTVATKDFNGVSLFTSASLNVTIDADGSTFSMSGINLASTTYTGVASASIATQSSAASALTALKSAINQLSQDRASIGANQTRLTFTGEQLVIGKENLMAASSRIQDVDVADESTEYAKQNIMVQAGTAMLAQANALSQNVLRLLQQ